MNYGMSVSSRMLNVMFAPRPSGAVQEVFVVRKRVAAGVWSCDQRPVAVLPKERVIVVQQGGWEYCDTDCHDDFLDSLEVDPPTAALATPGARWWGRRCLSPVRTRAAASGLRSSDRGSSSAFWR